MSVVGLSLEWRDDVDLHRVAVAFERAGAEVVQLGKYVFPELSKLLEEHEAQQFDEEGGGPAGTWAPLSEQYAAQKARMYPGKGILERTGTLRAALTGASSFARREWSDDDFAFGTVGVPYASFHQTGTARMPKRPPVDFGSGFEADVQRIAEQGLRRALREADSLFAEVP